MSEISKEKRYLKRLINNKKLLKKDFYYLIISSKINKKRLAKQSRKLHNDFYDEKMNYLSHLYYCIEYPEEC